MSCSVVGRKKRETEVRGRKEKPNYTNDVLADIRSTIHQQSVQRTNSNIATKTSIIKQTHNYSSQHNQGTVLTLLIESEGILLSMGMASSVTEV